jgi:hypothetical protein
MLDVQPKFFFPLLVCYHIGSCEQRFTIKRMFQGHPQNFISNVMPTSHLFCYNYTIYFIFESIKYPD